MAVIHGPNAKNLQGNVFDMKKVSSLSVCFNFFLSETLCGIGIDHFRILGIGLELACNGSSCGGISLKRKKVHLTPKVFFAKGIYSLFNAFGRKKF